MAAPGRSSRQSGEGPYARGRATWRYAGSQARPERHVPAEARERSRLAHARRELRKERRREFLEIVGAGLAIASATRSAPIHSAV
jgi:hypothetical protein